jgi:hypothetical protein
MEHVRRLSKTLFGALYRLEVCAALEAGELVTLTGLAEMIGKPPSMSSVAKELQILEEAGLLVRQPPVEGLRTVYLDPLPSPLWDACRALMDMDRITQAKAGLEARATSVPSEDV